VDLGGIPGREPRREMRAHVDLRAPGRLIGRGGRLHAEHAGLPDPHRQNVEEPKKILRDERAWDAPLDDVGEVAVLAQVVQ
jgi:hypothetical protein